MVGGREYGGMWWVSIGREKSWNPTSLRDVGHPASQGVEKAVSRPRGFESDPNVLPWLQRHLDCDSLKAGDEIEGALN